MWSLPLYSHLLTSRQVCVHRLSDPMTRLVQVCLHVSVSALGEQRPSLLSLLCPQHPVQCSPLVVTAQSTLLKEQMQDGPILYSRGCGAAGGTSCHPLPGHTLHPSSSSLARLKTVLKCHIPDPSEFFSQLSSQHGGDLQVGTKGRKQRGG